MGNKLTILKPSDMHIHLRQGDMLRTTVRDASEWFCRGVVMPNTLPPVNSPEAAVSYRNEILSLTDSFEPLMTFKLYAGMTGEAVRKMAAVGAVVGKLYPAGVTTNSQDGVRTWRDIREALSAMCDLGMILSIHCEKPDASVLEREYRYHSEFRSIIRAFPGLKMVFEHISDRRSVDFVASLPENVAATVTAHHLLITLDDVIGGNMNPHNFCKPVVKGIKDMEAIRRAAFSGDRKFFFGSDSAPHLKTKKESGSAGGGIYSAPCAVPLMAELFEKEGQLDKLENFLSVYGPDFYGLPRTKEKLSLERKESLIPAETDGIVPFMAGSELHFRKSLG